MLRRTPAHLRALIARLWSLPGPAADGSAQEDGTLAELRECLSDLRRLVNEFARRAGLTVRAAGAEDEREAIRRLDRELQKRDAMLHRERERVAAQRRRYDDRKRVASERWHEIQRLRRHVKELERALGDEAGAALPRAPLPRAIEEQDGSAERSGLARLMAVDPPEAQAPRQDARR